MSLRIDAVDFYNYNNDQAPASVKSPEDPPQEAIFNNGENTSAPVDVVVKTETDDTQKVDENPTAEDKKTPVDSENPTFSGEDPAEEAKNEYTHTINRGGKLSIGGGYPNIANVELQPATLNIDFSNGDKQSGNLTVGPSVGIAVDNTYNGSLYNNPTIKLSAGAELDFTAYQGVPVENMDLLLGTVLKAAYSHGISTDKKVGHVIPSEADPTSDGFTYDAQIRLGTRYSWLDNKNNNNSVSTYAIIGGNGENTLFRYGNKEDAGQVNILGQPQYYEYPLKNNTFYYGLGGEYRLNFSGNKYVAVRAELINDFSNPVGYNGLGAFGKLTIGF